MNKILHYLGKKNFNQIKHQYTFSQLNQFFSMNPKKCDYFFKSIGIVSKNNSSIGNSNFFTIGDTLEKDIEWSLIALKFNIDLIHSFINKERLVFKNIFLGNYDKAIYFLNKIDNEVSYSQWSILMRMTILYLKNEEEELTNYTNMLLDEENLGQTVRETIFLHFKKLTKDISEKKDFQSLISDLEYQLSIRESIFIKEFTKKKYEEEIYHQLLSVEKYATSPFNRKTQKETLKYLFSLSYEYSIIDLYKTFAMIISELQTEGYNLDKKIEDIIFKLFPKTNLIKVNRKFEIQNLVKSKKLFFTYETYLKGDFNKVIEISKKHLYLYPYDIDFIYFLVNSSTYLEKNPFDFLHELNKNSLLHKIIFHYYNLINNINPDESLSKIKKILIIFGVQTQWSMYLYSLLFNFLCLQRDTKKERSFSKSLYYSYHFHPRFFYNLDENMQKIFLERIENNKLLKNSNTLKIFKLHNNSNKKVSDLTIEPTYRSDYIISTYEKDLDKLELLYKDENIKFNTKIKIITDYINLLYVKSCKKYALKIMVENMHKYKIPLCMFKYKDIINEINEELVSMPEYVYITILDNPLNSIKINFLFSKYLFSVNPRYSIPSRLAENITRETENIDILIFILSFILEDKHLEEFTMDIRNSRELINEQLKIMTSLKQIVFDENEKINFEEKIKKLTVKKSILNSKNFINRNKLRLDFKFIEKQICSNINKLENYKSLPEKSEENLYELITDPKVIYYPKGDSKESLLVSDLEKTLKALLYSEYGLLNEIEANIKHGFFEQRLFEPFFSEKLLSSKEGNKYILNHAWQQKEKLQKFLTSFTDEVIYLVNEFKEVNLSSNANENKRILNFDKKLIYKNLNLNEMMIRIEFFDDDKIYTDYIIETILTIINNLLNNYRNEIIKVLTIKFNSLVKRNLTKLSKLNDINKEPVIDAFNNLNPKINEAILDVASWFEIYDESIHEPYSLNEILDSNTIKKTNINCQVKGEMLKLFKGSTYKLVYSMIFNIFYNVLKHATPKEIIISLTNNINGDLDISFKNKFNKNENDDSSGKGLGIEIIKKSLSLLNECDINEIDNYYNVSNEKDLEYVLKIKLLEKVFCNE